MTSLTHQCNDFGNAEYYCVTPLMEMVSLEGIQQAEEEEESIYGRSVLKVLLEFVPSETYLSGNDMIHTTAVKDMNVLQKTKLHQTWLFVHMLETCLSATEAHLVQNYETRQFSMEDKRTNLLSWYVSLWRMHKEAKNILVMEIQKKFTTFDFISYFAFVPISYLSIF